MLNHIPILLEKIRRHRGRLIFAALFWAAFAALMYEVSPKMEKAQHLHRLTKAHYYSVRKFNSYLDIKKCDLGFDRGQELNSIENLHREAQGKSNLSIDPFHKVSELTLSKLSFRSFSPDLDDEILTNGYLLSYRNSNKCFGILY